MPTDAAFGKRRTDRSAPRRPTAEAVQRPAWLQRLAAAPGRLTPHATLGLLLVLILVFACQEAFNLGAGGAAWALNHRSLVAFGGDGGALLQAGQWWRLFTAPMLHANAGHIIDNGVCLLLAGVLLERVIGWSWFLAVYMASGLGGELMSVGVNDPRIVGIGASGAIVGVLATCLVCSFHPNARWRRAPMRGLAFLLLLSALAPLSGDAAAGGINVNYSAHAGGAVVGVVMGLLINAVWPQGEARPVLAPAAGLLGLVGVAVTVVAGALVLTHLPAYRAIDATLAPDTAFPKPPAEQIAAAPALLARYPLDPRLHGLRAEAFAAADDFSAAESELRTALAETDQLGLLGDGAAEWIRLELVQVLLAEGLPEQASVLAAPLCHETLGEDADRRLAETGVCPASDAAAQPSGSSR